MENDELIYIGKCPNLTYGKVYRAFHIEETRNNFVSTSIWIWNDVGELEVYLSSDFTTISDIRDGKINQLGI